MIDQSLISISMFLKVESILYSHNHTNGGFHKWGIPNSWMVYKGKSHLKMDDDWGYPNFRKPPSLNISRPCSFPVSQDLSPVPGMDVLRGRFVAMDTEYVTICITVLQGHNWDMCLKMVMHSTSLN